MNKKLINYYNKELRFLRELGQSFAKQYPKIAARLNLNDNETPDPYVERLLEGVAFLTARTQLKIDSEYPKFVQRILEVVYPQFLQPTPSSTIVKFESSNNFNISVINKFKRGHKLETLPIEINNSKVSCLFSVTQDIELTPIVLESTTYTNSLDYLFNIDGISLNKSVSSLRLNFSLKSSTKISDLTPDELVLFLGSNLPASSQLLFLLMSSCNGVVCHSCEDSRQWSYVLSDLPRHKGFDESEALTFDLKKSISSLRILQEYIQLPEKFLFVSQKGVKESLTKAENDGHFPTLPNQLDEVVAHEGVNKRVVNYQKRQFSLSFLFDKDLPELSELVKENDISINTAPVVNLFKKRSVRFPVDMENLEHHVIIDRVQPLNFEVHSIERVKGFDKFNNQQVVFTPIYQAKDHGVFLRNDDENSFFSLRRESRTPSSEYSIHGGRTSYLGSEVYMSLIKESESILQSNIDQLSVEAWCTNRDLPLILKRSTDSDFLIDSGLPIRAAKIISEVKKPITTVDEHQTLWSLLNQLNLSYTSLFEESAFDSTLKLKELLLAFPHANNVFFKSEVNSIKQFEIEPITRIKRFRGAGNIRKGVAIKIVFDDNLLAGIHPYLFASVLRYYFSRSISINSFLELTIETLQQGTIAVWDGLLEGEKALL